MTDETIDSLTVDGARYAYRLLRTPSPRTAPVVLLGGVFQGIYGWYPTDETLNQVADVVTLEYFGETESVEGAPPTTAVCRAVEQIADRLGARRINLIGYSYGSVPAHAYALKHPERVERLMLGGVPTGTSPAQEAITRRLAAAAAAGRVTEVATAWVENMLCMDPEVEVERRELAYRCMQRTLLHQLREPNALLRLRKAIEAQIKVVDRPLRGVPTLVFSGAHDTLTPVAGQRAFAETIENGSFTVIDGADHLVLLERPEEVAALALRFFAGPLAPPARPHAAERTGSATGSAAHAEATRGGAERAEHVDLAVAQLDGDADRDLTDTAREHAGIADGRALR